MADTKAALSALDIALKAPTITFNEASMTVVQGEIGSIVLTIEIADDGQGGRPRSRRVTVAQIQGSVEAFASLREAIDGLEAELLAAPASKIIAN